MIPGKKVYQENFSLAMAWQDVPLGTEVIVRKDDGSEVRTKTRSHPWMLGNHTAVIQVEGISGCYALKRIRKAV